ncbi:MAG TPA: NAD(P)/FAD-dependent oxidoreductase [Arachidicoccus sp.]|nr:NAD(P)/FAD-dependent oxidoreductase [Arachidicoccus sp.]
MKRLVVIGGGAAGYFCAVNAARMLPGLQVVILEKTGKTLSKVKVSGGGRCNVTHDQQNVHELVKSYPRGKNFLKRALFQFSPVQTMEWFEQRGVPLKTEKDGRVFPRSNHSQSIIDCLDAEVEKYGIQLQLHANVQEITNTGTHWALKIGGVEDVLIADDLCIACGGFGKLEQFKWLESLGHKIVPPVPSLFTFNLGKHAITDLMGVSVDNAVVRINGTKLIETGPLLITHWGFSGPVILRLSAWGANLLAEKEYQFMIQVNWLGDRKEQQLRTDWSRLRDQLGNQQLGDKNPFALPKRLWLYLLSAAGIEPGIFWSKLPAKPQNKLIQLLVSDTYVVNGKTTFKEEFVTCGGIDLAEVDPFTMESRIQPHLYFAGEVLNVDGITGGYNFQHAWASGWAAACQIAKDAN